MQRIHGLLLRSEHPLPALLGASAGEPDVDVKLHEALPDPADSSVVVYASAADHDVGLVVRRDGPRLTFRYEDGSAFDVALAAHPIRIDAVIGRGQTVDDLVAYLYGPVLGFVLRARGTLALHASAIVVNDRAVLFVGGHGAGKSTLAAALAQRGTGVLSDDLVALTASPTGEMLAHPAMTHLRVWPSSEPLLYGRTNVLERLTPTWDKRRVPLEEGQYVDRATSVSRVYLLRVDHSRGSPRSAAVPPREALLALATETYANYLLDTRMRARELTQLGELIARVELRELVRPAGAEARTLQQLCAVVIEDAAANGGARDGGKVGSTALPNGR